MFPFFEAKAHHGDLLHLHLERVARSAIRAIPVEQREIRLIAWISGLFHDLGKATPYFQWDRLQKQKRTPLTSHAKVSAIFSWWFTEQASIQLWMRLATFISILRHHGNLDKNGWDTYYKQIKVELRDQDDPLVQQLHSIDWFGVHQWLIRNVLSGETPFKETISLQPPNLDVIIKSFFEGSDHRISHRELKNAFKAMEPCLRFLAGFGALLSADKIDSAGAEKVWQQHIPGDAVEIYIRKYFGRSKTDIYNLRRNIAKEVEQTWLKNLDRKLFTLTAPTGSGKTLSVFNAALKVRNALTNTCFPRIIYCLPFTSVIDQNYQVFQDVLDESLLADREDILLKHHHLVEGVYRTKDTEHRPDEAGELLTETWQSEIVVTTFYQLLHTLLSNKNLHLKRASQLVNSIVLMDEVQAVPLKYWRMLQILFKETASALNVRFVLLTATRPLIFSPDDDEIVELLPNHKHYFHSLSRVNLECHPGPIELNKFVDLLENRLRQHFCSTLIVLNRRKAVKRVFDRLKAAFPNKKLIALSTDLTPWDRRARIRLINSMLKRSQSCIVVATQLIEAGVDVSFPEVHRDLAPLDSIIQTCGRSNRHNTEAQGVVHLWHLLEDKNEESHPRSLWRRIYDPALIDVTRDVLGLSEASSNESFYLAEQEFLQLSGKYFAGCLERSEHVDLIPDFIKGNWAKLDSEFELIPNGPPTVTCFIIKNQKDQKIWDRYLEIINDDNVDGIQKKSMFAFIKRSFYERVIQVYAAHDPLRPAVTPIYVHMGHYNRETGFLRLPEQESSTIF